MFRPAPIVTSSNGDKSMARTDEDELILMSRLREICKGLDFDTLPEGIKEVLAGSSKNMGNNGGMHGVTQTQQEDATQDPAPRVLVGNSPSQQQLVILTRPTQEAGHSPQSTN